MHNPITLTRNPSRFAIARQKEVQADLLAGTRFEDRLGRLLTGCGAQVCFANRETAPDPTAYQKDYEASRSTLGRHPDLLVSFMAHSLAVECSWRTEGFYRYKPDHSGLPEFKMRLYAAQRPPETLVAIGSGGTAAAPSWVRIATVADLLRHGHAEHYQPFACNLAKHSPQQWMMHERHWSHYTDPDELAFGILKFLCKK